MKEYCVMTESTCDLPPTLAQELQLTILPLTFTIEGKVYENHLDGREMSGEAFYQALREGKTSQTSQVTQYQFAQAFEEKIAQGLDVLCISFSSVLSGTCESAMNAAAEVSKKHPEAKVIVLNSLAASGGQGLLVYHAVQQKRRGKTIEEVADEISRRRLHLRHWFTVHNLVYLKRGGRISSATALLGGMLDIKPILHVDEKGALASIGKVRGRANSLRAMADRMAGSLADSAPQTVIISHGDCLEDAKKLEGMVRARVAVEKLYISDVGPVIGAHVGPGVIALFHWGTSR